MSATRALSPPTPPRPPAGPASSAGLLESRVPVDAASAPGGSAGQRALEERVQRLCRADLLQDDLTGRSLGPYALGRRLGRGGMGCVFAATHLRLQRTVAIKFMAPELAANAETLERFDREILALGRMQHPNIVNAIDAGTEHGIPYLVTELVNGRDFEQLIEDHGPLPLAVACELIRQTALGLAYSHRLGFLHRDIKPSNLILDSTGVVNILDFGLVCQTAASHRLTAGGSTMGTWDYIAPEQARDASQVDERSDLYSLGCTLLFLLTGEPPFSDAHYEGAAAKLQGHLFDQPAALVAPPTHLPAAIVSILVRLLAKRPEERFQSADELIVAITPWSHPESVASAAQPVPTVNEAPSESAGPSANASELTAVRRRRLWSRLLPIGLSVSLVGVGWLAWNRPWSGPGASQPTSADSVPAVAAEVPGSSSSARSFPTAAPLTEPAVAPSEPKSSDSESAAPQSGNAEANTLLAEQHSETTPADSAPPDQPHSGQPQSEPPLSERPQAETSQQDGPTLVAPAPPQTVTSTPSRPITIEPRETRSAIPELRVPSASTLQRGRRIPPTAAVK